jgi:hypothetical protein
LQKGIVYYRCHAETCRGTSIAESTAIDEVRTKLGRLSFPQDVDIGDVGDVLQELIDAERTGERQRLNQVERDLAKLEERLSQLTDLLMEGTVDRDTYTAKKEELLLARQSLLDIKRESSANRYWDTVRRKFELGFAALQRYENGYPDERREVLDSMTSNFSVRTKEAVLTMVSPLAEFASWANSNECGLAGAKVRTREQIRQFIETLPDIAPDLTAGESAGYDAIITMTGRPSTRSLYARRHLRGTRGSASESA